MRCPAQNGKSRYLTVAFESIFKIKHQNFKRMKEPRSPHVLNASSNLIGICFLVITSLRFFSKSSLTLIDELSSVAMVFFMSAALLSFLSLNRQSRRGLLLERIASILFLIGLVILFFITMFFSFRLID